MSEFAILKKGEKVSPSAAVLSRVPVQSRIGPTKLVESCCVRSYDWPIGRLASWSCHDVLSTVDRLAKLGIRPFEYGLELILGPRGRHLPALR